MIFRLGKIKKGGAVGPGLFTIIPCIDDIIKVDLRTVTFDVPSQEILTKDSVTVTVDAVVYYKVHDPLASVVNVANASKATRLLGSTTLRNMLGTKNLHVMQHPHLFSSFPQHFCPGHSGGQGGRCQVDAEHSGRRHGQLGHQGGAGGDQGREAAPAAAAGHGSRGRGLQTSQGQGDFLAL